MNIFSKTKIFCEAYLAEKAEVPLKDLIETKAPILDLRAPEGRQPVFYSVQNDGVLVKTELEQQEGDISDELALRFRMGNAFSNLHQQRATSTLEDISRHEMQIRDLADSLQEQAEKRDELLRNSADYHFAKREALKNMVIFFITAFGESGAMFFLFADFFGIDSLKISSAALKHPVSVLLTVCLTISFFVATLRIAEQVLCSERRAPWFAGLIGIALLIGGMRAIQSAAVQETDFNLFIMASFYTTIGIILPLAAAYSARNWQEASQVAGLVDSTDMRLAEQVLSYNSRLREVNTARTRLNSQLDQLTDQYVKHYQSAVQKKEQLIKDRESHHRYVEAYLAELRFAYIFWAGWHARGMAMPKAVKKGFQIAALLLIILIVSLSSCHMAYAESQFNLLAVCDRSSSASGISCTSETLKDAGIYWIGRADEAGGGKFEVFLIDQGFDTAVILFSAEYPEKFPGPVSMHKKKWRNTFLQRLTDAIESLPTNKGSAVVEAIYRASLRIPDGGETLLYVMSDMRQQNTVFNFEKNVPSEKEFLRWLEISSIKPTIKASTNILVCGIHPYTPAQTSRMTTENYDRLLKLWRSVFTQWGVKADINEACSLKRKE